ncbi:MAG: acetate--CoA ligase family protein [Burkholderiales bacterium]
MSGATRPPPASLRALFAPRSIAIVGASDDPQRIGGRPLAGCLALGYGGALYPVNPTRSHVQGVLAYPSLAAVQAPVDLAVIALPAARCVQTIEECAAHGVQAAVLLSAGFAEVDSEGAARQARMAGIARDAGMRIVGPNCMGALNLREGVVASFTSLVDADPARCGGISVVSQSGAFGSHCLALMRERGLGIDLWVTTGNQADVDVADCIAHLAQAPDTKVIAACVEGVTDGDRMVSALASARAARVPVVLLKLGRSAVGRAAAATHTASLSGESAVFDAVVGEFGVHLARSVDELFDVAYACTAGKFPATGEVGLITTSGGAGVLMADAAADAGLAVPALPLATQARLRELVPFASLRNPLDVTGQFINDASAVQPMFEALLRDGGFPATVCYVGSSGVIPSLMQRLEAPFAAVAAAHADHLFVLSMIGSHEVRRRYESLGYLVFEDPTRAVAAVAALHRLGRAFAGPDPRDSIAEDKAQCAPPGAPGSVCDEAQSKSVLAAAGIEFLPEIVARSAGEAAAAAARFAVPVALKVLSRDVPHKSDAGGVALDVVGADEARDAFLRIASAVARAVPHAAVEGVLVAPMAGEGVEMIVGTACDPSFGPVVMVGVGGVFVETLRATALKRAPFGVEAARDMIEGMPGAALLRGVRGRPAADIEALAELVSRLSRFAFANRAWLASVDLNPVLVRAGRGGAVALDALVVLRDQS